MTNYTAIEEQKNLQQKKRKVEYITENQRFFVSAK